jgi:hypothetical protein
MRDADLQMLSMGLEPVPWDEFADAIQQSAEDQFQAIEQRACTEEVLQQEEPPGPNSLVGATLIVRSKTIIAALRMASHGWNASGATARMMCLMAEALPEGAQLDMIVSTPIVLQAFGTCADILRNGRDIDQYCQDPEWKELVLLWRSKHLHAIVRKVDEDGMDEDNSPFLKLAIEAAIHNNNNTFTWSSPSGVHDCTLRRA